MIPNTSASCQGFAQETWEARSSGSSFSSNPSDIETEGHSISNCGTVEVIKRTDPRGINQDFHYTSSGLLVNGSGNLLAGGNCNGLYLADANFLAHYVDETVPPTSYGNGDPLNPGPYNATNHPSAYSVSVTKSSTCGDGNEASVGPVTDPPLTDITATASSEDTTVGGGGSASTITCKNTNGGTTLDTTDPASGPNIPDPSVSALGLLPGVYTCVITVDP